MVPLTPRQKRAEKAAKAKQLLKGASLSRNDFEDEDVEWDWIRGQATDDEKSEDSNDSEDEENATTPRKRKRRAAAKSQKMTIVGARKGNFTCKVGDTVLVENGHSAPWIAIICSFEQSELDGDMLVNFLWFADEKDEVVVTNKNRAQIKNRRKAMPHEKFIMPFTDISPLESINGMATILSKVAFSKKFPNGNIPKKSKEFGTTFFCQTAYNDRTGTYSANFTWGQDALDTEEEVAQFQERIHAQTGSNKRKKGEKRKREDDFIDDGSDDDAVKGTPRKRQKNSTVSTPRKPRTPSKLLTPSHKRVVVKKPLEFTPLGTRVLDPEHFESSPFQTARSRLHVASVPTSLPCREDEFASVYSHLEAAIQEGTGACIYISGTPGTGKTATVREVVAQLNASVMADELDDFIFVEINGMKVTDPHQSYSLLWEALKGDRVSPTHALDLLEREFSHPNPRRVPCVVLMDELDQLVTKNQSVMYNFFNWPNLRHSRLIVLAVANTMDLPERTLSNKISSRLGLTRITFPGYNRQQLMQIIQSRLEGVPGNIVKPDAIQMAASKVAAVSGDARRALDICRRAVELAEADVLSQAAPNTPSKSGRGEKTSTPSGIVTIKIVQVAIAEATSSPMQQYLRGLPLSSKVFLAALIARTRRTGIGESILGDVIDEAKNMSKMDTGSTVIEYLLKDEMVRRSSTLSGKEPRKVPRVLGMGNSALDLMEAGIVGLEARRTDRTGKIRLSIAEEDVKQAFKDDPEVKSLGFQ